MNKNEFKAINMIAKKMNWQNKSVECVIETINQMVMNDQALGLDCCGECDDFEETLLSIALWDADKIASTMYVSDYESLVMWGVYSFCDEMGIDMDTFNAMLQWNSCKMNFLAPEYEAEEETIRADYDYWLECSKDAMWMNHHC